MKLLLDTNIIIPIEPTSPKNVEINTPRAARLVQLANKAGTWICIHPAQYNDFARDLDEERAKTRSSLLLKYQLLEAPPDASHLTPQLASVPKGSNEDVDNQLLAAVAAPAVDYLVTEDQGIHRKALKFGLSDRVLTIADAVYMLEALFDVRVAPPPAVDAVSAYQLNKRDPIWASFREDYPPFDTWLAKCMREHRQGWKISGENGYAGIAIVNAESDPPLGMKGKILKLCSMKVSAAYAGFKFGELLLKTIFRYAEANQYDWIFVEVLREA